MREKTFAEAPAEPEQRDAAQAVSTAVYLPESEEAPEELTVSEIEAAPAPKKDGLRKAMYVVGALALACLLAGILDPAVTGLMIALAALLGMAAGLMAIARSGHWEVFWYGFGRVLILILRFIFEVLIDALLHSGSSGSHGRSSRGSGGFGGFGGARGGGGRTSGGGAGRR